MRVERLAVGGDIDAVAAARRVRALVPSSRSVEAAVREIVEEVRRDGDAAVARHTARLDVDGDPPPLLVAGEQPPAALATLEPQLRGALELARANVQAVARAWLGVDAELTLGQGQRIVLRELAVGRAAVYVPGGRAPYPSTVVMGATTARAAGVADVVVCTPPGRDGGVDPAILAACALCGVDRVYRMGGAQAIAALAHGTETVEPVDVIVGPGNLYVQEAKRQLADRVGIDGFAGPSDLLVVIDAERVDDARLAQPAGEALGVAPHELSALGLDLVAQAEHGAGSLIVAASPSERVLAALQRQLESVASDADAALVQLADLEHGLAFAEALAPEHLQLVGPGAQALAPRVRHAGCVFVGAASGTAFGDYVCGSNHVLPTGGAARFASGLNVGHFRRRVSEVHLDADAAAQLAGPGAAIARAEGFGAHAKSMEARIGQNGAS